MTVSRRSLLTIVFAAAILCAIALVGCQVSVSGAYTFDGGKTEINGKTLTVSLDSNPTTGYEWTTNIAGDGITQTQEEYETTTTTTAGSNSVGTSGTSTFTFEGEKAGESTITFTYARSWETTSEDQKVEVKVTTDNNGNITKTSTVIDGKEVGSSKA